MRTTRAAGTVRGRRGAAPLAILWMTLTGALLGTLASCATGDAVDPILRLSAQEALERGKELMAEEKYVRAQDYLSHAFEVSPNSVEGREALLLVADSHYLDGGRSSYIQAEAKYRDFLNRFPTSERAAYVQFQIANSLAQRMGRPDPDRHPRGAGGLRGAAAPLPHQRVRGPGPGEDAPGAGEPGGARVHRG